MSHSTLNDKQKEARNKWEQERMEGGRPLTGYGPKANGPNGWKYKPPANDAAPAPQGKKNKSKYSRSPSRSSAGSADKPKKKDPSTIVCGYTKNGDTCKRGDACKLKHPDVQV